MFTQKLADEALVVVARKLSKGPIALGDGRLNLAFRADLLPLLVLLKPVGRVSVGSP